MACSWLVVFLDDDSGSKLNQVLVVCDGHIIAWWFIEKLLTHRPKLNVEGGQKIWASSSPGWIGELGPWMDEKAAGQM